MLPDICWHQAREMADTGSCDASTTQQRRLCGEDDITIERGCIGGRASLLAEFCPKGGRLEHRRRRQRDIAKRAR